MEVPKADQKTARTEVCLALHATDVEDPRFPPFRLAELDDAVPGDGRESAEQERGPIGLLEQLPVAGRAPLLNRR